VRSRSLKSIPYMLAVLLFALSFIRAAQGTTFANRPMGAVLKESEFIVRGRTGASQSNWGKGEAKGSIFTYTDFEVSEVLKGDSSIKSGDRIFLRQPGGEKDGIEMSVAATAHFQPGQDVVVTLASKEATDESYDIINLTAGKYDVVEENGETFLVNSLGGNTLYDPHSKDSKNTSYNTKISLSNFKKIIAVQIKEAPENSQPQKIELLHVEHKEEPKAAVKNQEQQNDPQVDKTEEPKNENHFVMVFIAALLLVVGIAMWKATSRGGKDP